MGLFDLFKRKAQAAAVVERAQPALAIPRRRGFDGAQIGRLTSDWITSTTTLDVEIRRSLKKLRERSRDMHRNNDYARSAVRAIVNNVIGSGIQLQAAVKMLRGKKMNTAANEAIEQAWREWSRLGCCTTDGRATFEELERLMMQTVVLDGEFFGRKVFRAFGASRVPLALEMISADRIDTELNGFSDAGNEIRMGVERDTWGRPLAYYVDTVNEADVTFVRGMMLRKKVRVPASEIVHLYRRDAIDQTRGVPWFASAIMRMHHLAGYTEAEVIAARAEACRMGFITSPEDDAGETGKEADGTPVSQFEPGTITRLLPGEQWQDAKPNRPGGQFEPFVRMMLHSMAAGLGISYASLSRDYSQSNYSSSRLSLLDDRDEWRALQCWFIGHFREPLHAEWLELAQLGKALDLPNYDQNRAPYRAVKFVPRGWSWIDPVKEIAAFKDAVRSGFTTQSEIIAQNGGDFEEVLEQRKYELECADEAELIFDTDSRKVSGAGQAMTPAAPGAALTDGTDSADAADGEDTTDSAAD